MRDQQSRKNDKGTLKEMGMSLSQRIAERVRKKKASIGGQNRAAFLALKGDIEDALKDGWPIKSVWETLFEEKKVSFSYQAFRNYVNSLIYLEKEPGAAGAVTPPKHPQSPTSKIQPPTPKEIQPATPVQTVEKTPAPPQPDRFNFDPNPKKEDYL